MFVSLQCAAAADAVFAHWGRIDYLVNNAAGNFMVSAENLSPNGLATVLGIDLQGVFHMSKVPVLCFCHNAPHVFLVCRKQLGWLEGPLTGYRTRHSHSRTCTRRRASHT